MAYGLPDDINLRLVKDTEFGEWFPGDPEIVLLNGVDIGYVFRGIGPTGNYGSWHAVAYRSDGSIPWGSVPCHTKKIAVRHVFDARS